MPEFSIHERNLLALYYAGDRNNTIEELNNMKTYLAPDEKDLKCLTDGVLAKLNRMTDEEFDRFTDTELTY